MDSGKAFTTLWLKDGADLSRRKPRDRRTSAQRRLSKRTAWRLAIPGLMGPYLDFEKSRLEQDWSWDRGLQEDEVRGLMVISFEGQFSTRASPSRFTALIFDWQAVVK